MTVVLKDLPFYDRDEIFYLDPLASGKFVRILPRQIPVRVSLCLSAAHQEMPSALSFPAILDTGFNGTFAISSYHLRTWARLRADDLGQQRATGNVPLIRGLPAQLREAKIWIRENAPRAWSRGGENAHRFHCPGGIFVVQSEPADQQTEPVLRLPLLGMKAFQRPGGTCRLQIDFAARLVQLRI